MEVIAHVRTSSNDRRSHLYDTGISNECVINFYCPFGPPPMLEIWLATAISLQHRKIFIYFVILTFDCFQTEGVTAHRGT